LREAERLGPGFFLQPPDTLRPWGHFLVEERRRDELRRRLRDFLVLGIFIIANEKIKQKKSFFYISFSF